MLAPTYSKPSLPVPSVLVTAANASSQGGGTIGGGAPTMFLVMQAGAEGAYVDFVRWEATATAPVATNASCARIYRSTIAAGATTSADTALVDECTLPSVNAGSTTVATPPFDRPLGIWLAPNECLLASHGVAPAANSAWRATAMGAGNA